MVKGMPKAAHEDKPMNSKIRSVANAESDIKSSEDNWPQVCEAVTKGEKMSSTVVAKIIGLLHESLKKWDFFVLVLIIKYKAIDVIKN